MKKIVLIIAIASCSLFVKAQVAENKAVFNVVKQNKVIAVSPTKMAVLYIGIDNPVEIAIADMPIKYVTATVDSGEIESQGDGQFIVRINKSISVAKINLFENYNGTTTKIGEKIFRVKRVPDPIATIGGNKSGIISKSILSGAGGLIPVMENFDFELFFTITSFTMSMNVKGDLIEKIATGNKLTAEMIKLINSGTKGTKIYFENIKAVGPDGNTRTLSPINLKII
jgi:gliding motility-associated protein GldM